MKYWSWIISTFILFAEANSGFSFDTTVHARITAAAVSGSSGFASYLQDNNISTSKEYVDDSWPIENAGPTAFGCITDGSVLEDNLSLDNGGKRPLNHFYDPIHNKGLTIPVFTLGLPSQSWAAIFNQVNSYHPPDYNQYSWQNARAYQSNSIVQSGSATRDQQASLMFRSLGQVVHLLEDTAQPQHSRNEQHYDGIPLNVLGWESALEDWGRDNITKITFSPQQFDWVAAGFTAMSSFWSTGLYNGTSTAPLAANESGGPTLGLAEFCNGNFLTARGSYAEYPSFSKFGPNPYSYAYPSITCTDFSHYQGNPAAYAKLMYTSYSDSTQVYRCVVQKNSQGVAVPAHSAIDLLAAYQPNVLAQNAGIVDGVHADDPDVMASYYSVLVPRAIAYSTGLINYYFRGRLQIQSSSISGSTLQFTAQNISPQAFSGGTFRAFSDDYSGNRTEVTGLSTTYSGNLAVNGTITGSCTLPGGWGSTVTLAYFGNIGTTDPVDANQGCASVAFSVSPYSSPIYRSVIASPDYNWTQNYNEDPFNCSFDLSWNSYTQQCPDIGGLITWVNGYDMTTVPYGNVLSATFSPNSSTPDSGTTGLSQNSAWQFWQTVGLNDPCGLFPFAFTDGYGGAVSSQIQIPAGLSYYVVYLSVSVSDNEEVGTPYYSTADFLQCCSATAVGDLTLNIPVPPPSSCGCVNGVAVATVIFFETSDDFSTMQDFVTWLQDNLGADASSFSSGWNISTTCPPENGDPFSGSP